MNTSKVDSLREPHESDEHRQENEKPIPPYEQERNRKLQVIFAGLDPEFREALLKKMGRGPNDFANLSVREDLPTLFTQLAQKAEHLPRKNKLTLEQFDGAILLSLSYGIQALTIIALRDLIPPLEAQGLSYEEAQEQAIETITDKITGIVSAVYLQGFKDKASHEPEENATRQALLKLAQRYEEKGKIFFYKDATNGSGNYYKTSDDRYAYLYHGRGILVRPQEDLHNTTSRNMPDI